MQLKKISINGYKSLMDVTIENPNPFSVFVGPNGAGKSNLFEALEFSTHFHYYDIIGSMPFDLFGGVEEVMGFKDNKGEFYFEMSTSEFKFRASGHNLLNQGEEWDVEENLDYGKLFAKEEELTFSERTIQQDAKQLRDNFTRISVGDDRLVRIKRTGTKKVLPDGSNSIAVLREILANPQTRETFFEQMQILVPGFEKVDVHLDAIGKQYTLQLFEEGTDKPFTGNLISSGTKNLIILLSAVLQSDEPQFLCIEEPENGLNPYVIRHLVNFFRKACEEKGHYIWLNTHSQTLVKELQPHELIVVDKIDGKTTIKQFSKEYDLHGLEMDEAWLGNALGGGVPW